MLSRSRPFAAHTLRQRVPTGALDANAVFLTGLPCPSSAANGLRSAKYFLHASPQRANIPPSRLLFPVDPDIRHTVGERRCHRRLRHAQPGGGHSGVWHGAASDPGIWNSSGVGSATSDHAVLHGLGRFDLLLELRTLIDRHVDLYVYSAVHHGLAPLGICPDAPRT